jgi:hypothetical protein
MLAGVGVSAVSTHETEIYAGERTGDTSREEHPSRDAAALLGGR